jgi:hypothetical protein
MNPREQGFMSYVCALVGLAVLGICAPASATTVINNLAVTGSTCASSPGPYVVQQAGLVAGATQYIDRTFTISGSVPSVVNGQTFVQTCNNDKNLSPGATSLVSFSVGQDSRVYILHDVQVTPEPTWLTANFTDLGLQITNDNSHNFELFVSNATYSNGSTVTLGSNIQSGTNGNYAMYSIVVAPVGGPLLSGLTVNNSTAAGGTGLPYQIQSNAFTAGAIQYVDRAYTIIAPVPTLVSGQTFIQTANSDKAVSPGSANFMSFTVTRAASVYVAIDRRVTTRPAWLTSAFTDTGMTVQGGGASPGVPFELFVKSYPAGSVVTLGSNIPAGGDSQNSMYSVIVAPAAITQVCATAVVVGLQWAPVASAVRYSISRNGTALAAATNIPVTYYNDQSVAPTTSYIYSVAALSSSGSVLSTQATSVMTAAASPNGDPPYCQSSTIPSMTIDWSSGINQQDGSDLWSQTLGNDGNEYGFFGDGGGFGGNPDGVANDPTKVSWGTGEIKSATPGTISNAVNVYGGANALHPANISGKATSLLAINSNFYAIGAVWGSGSTTGNAPAHQEIVSSNGNAWSWISNESNWTFCTGSSAGSTFCPGAFLQNGAGYSGNTDGFVYIYGGRANNFFGTTPQTQTYLWRVNSSSILDDTAYEAYGGLDSNGNPIWKTGDFTTLSGEMAPVFADPGPRPLGLGAVVYNSHLNRYIASAEGDVNQVAFYEAPAPWGPWATIGYFNSHPSDNSGGFGDLGNGLTFVPNESGDGLGINFLDKWTSSDGKTMWVVFSSDGTASSAAQLVTLQGRQMDSFSAVPITLTTSH